MECGAALSGFLSIVLMMLNGARFEETGSGDGQDASVDRLLEVMGSHGVDAYVTLASDEHLNEYIGRGDERVRFLTGFCGSNGMAVTCKAPVLYTDSRYYIQAERESRRYKLKRMEEDEGVAEYLEKIGCKSVGICKRLIGSSKYQDLKSKLKARGMCL